MNVIKRDGTIQEFEFSKIENAVRKAFESVNEEMTQKFIDQLKEEFEPCAEKNCDLEVEEIQDTIQNLLIKKNKYEVVEAFILYRNKRAEIRESKSDLIKEVQKKLEASDVQNQNANVDEYSFGGRIGEAARVVTKNDALKRMRKKSRKNHEDGYVYIHDLDSWSVGQHNCLTLPFDKLLANGCRVKNATIRPAGSVNSAMQLVAVYFQLQSLQQFGGVSASHLDWTMVPYVRKSFEKHYLASYCKSLHEFQELDILAMTHKEMRHWTSNKVADFFIKTGFKDEDFKFANKGMLDDFFYQEALYDTKNETYQATEAMYHNLNTLLSRSGDQLPFTSINYGTCTEPEGRMVTKAILEVSIEGIGKNKETSIFPCGIFQCMKGVNRAPGDPNYDLYRMALTSTSQRLYPNYANVDWSGNAGYDRNDPRTYFSTMGCHAKGTKIIMADGSKKNVEDIVVGDKIMGVNNQIRTVESLIRGNGKMFEVSQSRGETYVVNEGHILALEYSVERPYKGLTKHSKVNMSVHDFMNLPETSKRFFKGYKDSYELPEKEYDIPPYILGLWLGDGNRTSTRFSVNESETQILKDLNEYALSIGKKLTIRQEEGEKCLCVDIADASTLNEGNKLRQALVKYDLMGNKHIPEEYFYGSIAQRKALLAGLINTDGWARNGRGRQTVCFGNTNLDLINGAKRLADSVGYTTNVIMARDETVGKGICEGCNLKPYYHLSIHRFDDSHLMEKKRTLVNEKSSRNFSTSTLKIKEIGIDDFYGFELDGDKLYLINDNTVTHNCRTANGYDINGFGQLKDGRGNICPVTVILPKIAMESYLKVKKNTAEGEEVSEENVIKEFMKLLDKKIDEAKDTLIERFNHIASQSPNSAKFMYENGTMAGYVPEEGIISALKHGTLALGQLGLAECLQIMISCDHTTEKGMELAKKIEGLFKQRCAEYKEKYRLNFGVYYTPAENLCYTAMNKFRKQYGIIPNVSDKEYFTNSMHVPVWQDVDPFEKIDIESQLTSYSSAGCITYVELPSTSKHNVDALETLVNYAMDHDIPYFAVNVPNDQCQDCGYMDEIGETCPVCGSKNIKRLRRVTGYLTGDYKTAFNWGKQKETEDRVKHVKN